MDFQIDYSRGFQADLLFANFDVKARQKFFAFSKKHAFTPRLLGVPLVAYNTLYRVALSVAEIAESLIKGFVNILGSPFTKTYSLKTGLKQLFVQFPLAVVVNAIAIPILFVSDAITLPLSMLIVPTVTSALEKRQSEIVREVVVAKVNRAPLPSPIIEPKDDEEIAGLTYRDVVEPVLKSIVHITKVAFRKLFERKPNPNSLF